MDLAGTFLGSSKSVSLVKASIAGAGVLLCATHPGLAACVDIGGSPFFVVEGQAPVPLEPAFEDYSYMLYDTCEAIGLASKDCSYLTLMGDIGFNAVAAQCQPEWEAIIYDRRLSGLVGSDGAETIIAHELGHLRCGHLGDDPQTPEQARAEELEADAFAGAALRLRGFQRTSMESVLPILSEQPSLSHPGIADRRVALQAGFDDPYRHLCR